MKIFILLFVLLSINAEAGFHQAPKIVARFVEKKLAQLGPSIAKDSSVFGPMVHSEDSLEGYYLKRIRLQFSHFAAFKVSMLELKIVPSVEFRWTRKNPKGWVNYKRPEIP